MFRKVDNLLSHTMIDGRDLSTNRIWGSGEVCEVVCVEMVCVCIVCVLGVYTKYMRVDMRVRVRVRVYRRAYRIDSRDRQSK